MQDVKLIRFSSRVALYLSIHFRYASFQRIGNFCMEIFVATRLLIISVGSRQMHMDSKKSFVSILTRLFHTASSGIAVYTYVLPPLDVALSSRLLDLTLRA